MEEHMPEVLGTGVIILSFFGGIWKVSKDLRDDTSKKIGRVYERLDEHKDHMDKRYVPQDVCDILHQQIVGDVKEIKADVKEILNRNGGLRGARGERGARGDKGDKGETGE